MTFQVSSTRRLLHSRCDWRQSAQTTQHAVCSGAQKDGDFPAQASRVSPTVFPSASQGSFLTASGHPPGVCDPRVMCFLSGLESLAWKTGPRTPCAVQQMLRRGSHVCNDARSIRDTDGVCMGRVERRTQAHHACFRSVFCSACSESYDVLTRSVRTGQTRQLLLCGHTCRLVGSFVCFAFSKSVSAFVVSDALFCGAAR